MSKQIQVHGPAHRDEAPKLLTGNIPFANQDVLQGNRRREVRLHKKDNSVFPALAKRQGSPRRSEGRHLSISCCMQPRWPMATGQALPVLLHLECTVPASLLSSPSSPKGCPQTRCVKNATFYKSEREGGPAADTSKWSIACLLQGIFHPIYTSNTPMCPVQLCYAVL